MREGGPQESRRLTGKRSGNWRGVGLQGYSGIRQLDLEGTIGLGVSDIFVASLPSTSTEVLGRRPEGCGSLPSSHPVRRLGYEEKKVEVAK